MDGSVSIKRRKFLLIIYSLYLREFSSHKYCFVFLDTSISYMFDLIDALGSHYRLPFRSRNNIPHIIFHDGLIIFGHGIFPNLMTCCLSMTRRLDINDISHIWNISQKYLWSLLSQNVLGISTQFTDHKQHTTLTYTNIFLYASFLIPQPVYNSQIAHYSHLQALRSLPFPSALSWGSKAHSHSHTILGNGRGRVDTIEQTKMLLECSLKKINRVHINTPSLFKDNYFDLQIDNHSNLGII